MANRFNEYFTSVGSSAAQKANDLVREHNFHIDPTMSTVESMPDEMSDLFQFHFVIEKDVEYVIKGFSSNKAPGHDKITAQVLKDSLSATLPAITCIMNNSFNTRTFARQWKIAEVTPVLKSGDFEDPCNNRPISLLPILSKVPERLADRQLVDYGIL